MILCPELNKRLNEINDGYILFEKWKRGRPTKEAKEKRKAFQDQFKERSTLTKHLLK